MLPWIRKHNYSNDFFYTVYKLYAETFRAYPVTYYKINKSTSIMDDEFHNERGNIGLDSASYEKHNIGPLSGVRFDKITSFPVHNLETVQPTFDSGERGLSAHDSMTSSFSFPQIYGIRPMEGDMVDINWGMKQDGENSNFLWVVSNVNSVHFGDYLNLYKCSITPAGSTVPDLEKQIEKLYMFFEPEKKVVPLPNAVMLYKIISKMEILSKNFKTRLNQKTNLICNP